MASDQNRAELEARARQGDTVIPGGTGGKTLEAQEQLAEGDDSEEAEEGRLGGSSWGQKDTRRLGDGAGKPGKSSSAKKGIRK